MSETREGAGRGPAPGWLPESARRILLVSGSAPDDWSIAAALEVAEMVARHRPRTLFVNTVMGSAGPDRALQAEGLPGLGDVVSGRRTVAEVALRPADRSFIAVPAGGSVPGITDLSGSPAFLHLVEAAGRGGTLLLHVTETELSRLSRVPEAVRPLSLDGLVLLGEASTPRTLPAGLRLLARVAPESSGRSPEVPDAAAKPAPRRPSGFSRPSRTPAIVAGDGMRRRSPEGLDRWLDRFRKLVPARGFGGVVAVWLVAVLAVWLVWQGLSGWPAFEDEFIPPVRSPVSGGDASTTPPEAASTESSRAESDTATPTDAMTATPTGTSRVPAEAGIDLPYSVLVASVVPYEDATDKRDELLEEGTLAFVAPTPVGGRLYYRVFAGALADRTEARRLMRQLVERGDKDRERDWDMRPARFAFALGDFESIDDAESEKRRLHESGVPAYVLPVGDSTGAIYRLYSGAFESAGAATPADSLLSAAGLSATLVARRGEPQ